MTVVSYLDFAAPAGLRVRGTVLVVPGRGESVDTYRRFGSRIASDSWFVRVVDASVTGELFADGLSKLAGALDDAVADLAEEWCHPLVLIGSDISAAALAALVSRGDQSAAWWPDALVLAAIPGYGEHATGSDWESELEARTQCPVHREVLRSDTEIVPGSLSGAVDDLLLDEAYAATAAVPQLLLIGDDDPLADRPALVRMADALPSARLSVVRAGRHDILNDVQHRAVAAEVVGFLEALRGGSPIQPVISIASSDW
jgi:alpha-beta hydrolase superfamily lysophospholipase